MISQMIDERSSCPKLRKTICEPQTEIQPATFWWPTPSIISKNAGCLSKYLLLLLTFTETHHVFSALYRRMQRAKFYKLDLHYFAHCICRYNAEWNKFWCGSVIIDIYQSGMCEFGAIYRCFYTFKLYPLKNDFSAPEGDPTHNLLITGGTPKSLIFRWRHPWCKFEVCATHV